MLNIHKHLCLPILAFFLIISGARAQAENRLSNQATGEEEKTFETAVFAGGCFWCVETDFEKCPGVWDVVSGYSGGRSSNPTYQTYASGGHREVVLVSYDPEQITFKGLVEWLIKHIDPTNPAGQFKDVGKQYSPAVYYANEEEQDSAQQVIDAVETMNVFKGKKIGVELVERSEFWPAEAYHQDYHRKNPIKYNFFRLQSGRDNFVRSNWGVRSMRLELPGSLPSPDTENKPWLAFKKPSPMQLKKELNSMQFKVTQQDGTEPAFHNSYWNNKREGIYVDIVSGAPLFSSLDKYRTGTGWPSFVKPIEPDAVYFRPDRKMLVLRTEVRSRYGDSHLGHVFSDGPPARGGKRYCMNSAAMKFIPKEEMEEEGYGDYLKLFKDDSSEKE